MKKEKDNLNDDLIELKQQYESSINKLKNENKHLKDKYQAVMNDYTHMQNNTCQFDFKRFEKWFDEINVKTAQLQERKKDKKLVIGHEYIDLITDMRYLVQAFEQNKEKAQV